MYITGELFTTVCTPSPRHTFAKRQLPLSKKTLRGIKEATQSIPWQQVGTMTQHRKGCGGLYPFGSRGIQQQFHTGHKANGRQLCPLTHQQCGTSTPQACPFKDVRWCMGSKTKQSRVHRTTFTGRVAAPDIYLQTPLHQLFHLEK